MANARKTRVEIPQKTGPESHRVIAIVAALGFLVGIAWPILAGKHLGPNVPGIKKGDEEAGASASASAAPSAPPSAVALAGVAPSRGTEPPPASETAAKQTVNVDGGAIVRCWAGKEKLDGDACGSLKLDRTIVPLLKQLDTCPAALGLTGDLGVALEFDFSKKSIDVRRGRTRGDSAAAGDDAKSAGALPKTTVDGVLACVRDYLAKVDVARIRHEHSRYRVDFGLHFRAHGEAPSAQTDEEAAPANDAGDGLATIVWDSVKLRDEPRQGKVVARLVRGTRVEILGSRKEWFEVKLGNRKGWLYRSAIGR